MFTYDCEPTVDSTLIVKFADDTTVSGLIKNDDETKYRSEVEAVVSWCETNDLMLNVSKTKEIVIDFRKDQNIKEPLIIGGQIVEQVDNFKFLGSYISEDLKWNINCMNIIKKARQRMYFLRVLKSFRVRKQIFISFYRAIIESILTNSITVWFSAAANKDIKRMNSIVRAAEKVIGVGLPSLESIYNNRIKNKVENILREVHHPAHELFQMLPSKRRLRSFRGKTRFLNSLFPSAVRIFNNRY